MVSLIKSSVLFCHMSLFIFFSSAVISKPQIIQLQFEGFFLFTEEEEEEEGGKKDTARRTMKIP